MNQLLQQLQKMVSLLCFQAMLINGSYLCEFSVRTLHFSFMGTNKLSNKPFLTILYLLCDPSLFQSLHQLENALKIEILTLNGYPFADIIAAAVLSGNRNFEGRIHPLTRANYLCSPPLVIAYALAGTVCICNILYLYFNPKKVLQI